jgi:hypothetical protein
MEALVIQATDETPEIVLDPSQKQFVFSGKSLPEDVATFYSPVLSWLDAYVNVPLDETVVEFKMDYFNTASSKIVLDILMKLEEIHTGGGKLLIRWYCKESDVDMKEAGDEYAEIVEIPFEHLLY